MNQGLGWVCPSCGRGWAPWVPSCTHATHQVGIAVGVPPCVHEPVENTAGRICKKCGANLGLSS